MGRLLAECDAVIDYKKRHNKQTTRSQVGGRKRRKLKRSQDTQIGR